MGSMRAIGRSRRGVQEHALAVAERSSEFDGAFVDKLVQEGCVLGPPHLIPHGA